MSLKLFNFKIPKEFKKTLNLKKVWFAQQSSNAPSGMPSHKGEKGSKMSITIDISSTVIKRSTRLANKPKQKYILFAKLSLLVIEYVVWLRNPTSF